jgi:hypothetical protein
VETASRRIGRAAQRGRDLGVGEIAGVAEGHGGALFWRQCTDQRPDPLVQLGLRGDAGNLLRLRDRQRPASVGTVVVDRLAMGDGQQPTAQIAVVAQLRVGPQRRQEGLLEAVLGVAPADGAAQHRHHVGGVVV